MSIRYALFGIPVTLEELADAAHRKADGKASLALIEEVTAQRIESDSPYFDTVQYQFTIQPSVQIGRSSYRRGTCQGFVYDPIKDPPLIAESPSTGLIGFPHRSGRMPCLSDGTIATRLQRPHDLRLENMRQQAYKDLRIMRDQLTGLGIEIDPQFFLRCMVFNLRGMPSETLTNHSFEEPTLKGGAYMFLSEVAAQYLARSF